MSNQQTQAKSTQNTADIVRQKAQEEAARVAAIADTAPLSVGQHSPAGEQGWQKAPSRSTEFSAVDHRVLIAAHLLEGVIIRSNITDAHRQIPQVVKLTDALLAELQK